MVSNKSSLKTIKIEEDLHKELSKLGNKGDTFSNIIRRLLVYKKLTQEDKRVKEAIKSDWERKVA